MANEDYIRAHLTAIVNRVFDKTGHRLSKEELKSFLREIKHERIRAMVDLKIKQIKLSGAPEEGIFFDNYIDLVDTMEQKPEVKRLHLKDQSNRFQELYPDED